MFFVVFAVLRIHEAPQKQQKTSQFILFILPILSILLKVFLNPQSERPLWNLSALSLLFPPMLPF